MNIVVEKQPKCTASVSVEIPADTLRSERQKIVNSFNSKARVPGFRPGKTPIAIIEKRFHKEIAEQLNDQLTETAAKACLKEHPDLLVIDVITTQPLEILPDGTASISLKLILSPEITLPPYKGLKITLPPSTVQDSLIDNQIEEMRERMATFEKIEDRPVAAGDVTRVDFTSTINGEPLSKATSCGSDFLDFRENYWLKIEDESFLPGVAMQLIGMNPGDTRTVTVTIPEDHSIESLRNQTIDFAITLHEAGKMQLPELNDEFASKVLPEKTMAELREFIRQMHQQRMDSEMQQIKAEKIADAIVGDLDFELPEETLNEEIQQLTDHAIKQLASRGLSNEQILERQEDIIRDSIEQAERNLRINFTFQQIAKAENLKVSEHEVLAQIVSTAEAQNIPAKKFLRDVIRKRHVDVIRNRALFAKTIDFLIEQSEFVEASENIASESES